MAFCGFLKQSTAVDVLIGPFVDSTDGDTEETALTISQGDVMLSKNGQTAAQKNDATAAAHDADGFYNCELDATDTDTVGQLTLYVHEAGALCVRHDYQVIEEAVYDALYAASAAGPLQSTTAGRKLDVSAGGEAGIDWANIGSPTTAVNLSGTNIDTDQVVASVTGAVGSVTGAVGSVTGAVGSVTGLTAATVHSDLDDIQARLPAALTAGGNMKTDVLAVDGSTAAAARMERAAETMTLGTCDAGSTTTSIVAKSLAPASVVDDQWNGKIMHFDLNTTTTALRGQSTSISDYVHSTLTFTVVALTTAPSEDDTFVIV